MERGKDGNIDTERQTCEMPHYQRQLCETGESGDVCVCVCERERETARRAETHRKNQRDRQTETYRVWVSRRQEDPRNKKDSETGREERPTELDRHRSRGRAGQRARRRCGADTLTG